MSRWSKNNWVEYALSDVFWFQEGPGVRKWQFTNSGIKLLNVGNITPQGDIDLSKTDRYLDISEVEKKYRHFLVDAGDLVIASSGISFDKDNLLRTKAAFVRQKHLPLCMNTSTIRFKPKKDNVDLRFLKYWFDSLDFREQITRLVTGSAQQNFGPSHLESTRIFIPKIYEQKRIAAILDKADRLRRTRRYSQLLSDTFLQSVFVEMFGNPSRNLKKWQEIKAGELFDIQLGKMLSEKNYTGKNLRPYLGNANVQWGYIDLNNLKQMDFNEKDFKKYKLHKGDILVCEGGEVGRTAIWNGEIDVCCYQKALHRLRPITSRIEPIYFQHFMKAAVEYGLLLKETSQVTIAHFTAEKFQEFSILVPPVKTQQSFVRIAQRFERFRAQQREAARQAEHLFQTLLHRAFSGEL